MLFYEFWNALNRKKPIDGDVKMSPKQFKYMLEQSYNAGRKQGNDEGLKQGYELAKLVKPKATSAYDDFMRGFCADK
jgi:hypothetical protein